MERYVFLRISICSVADKELSRAFYPMGWRPAQLPWVLINMIQFIVLALWASLHCESGDAYFKRGTVFLEDFLTKTRKFYAVSKKGWKALAKTYTFSKKHSISQAKLRQWMHIAQEIEKIGWQVSNSLSKQCVYLLCGEKAGSKVQKANTLDIKVVHLSTLKEIIAYLNN